MADALKNKLPWTGNHEFRPDFLLSDIYRPEILISLCPKEDNTQSCKT